MSVKSQLPALTTIVEVLRQAAIEGGKVALRDFRPGTNTTARVTWKSGGSPVTAADLAADSAIASILEAALPGLAVLSEERVPPTGLDPDAPRIIVDPIDGTRAFMSGRTEWCVSIAFLRGRRPEAGVIFAPARNEMFEATFGMGALLNGRRLQRRIDDLGGDTLTVAGPKDVLTRLRRFDASIAAAEPLRALAYRLASVAAGTIGAAVASEGAHDWDIAAADVILAETGIALLTDSGAPPVYNASVPVHPALIAAPQTLAQRLLPVLAQAVA